MLAGSDSRSFSAGRLFAALGIVAVVSTGAYADSIQTAPTADKSPATLQMASPQQGVTLTSAPNVVATQSLAIGHAAGFVPSGSQDGSRQASNHACPESDCVSGIITQSDDTATDAGNQVACVGAGTTPNAWARCFDLAAEGFGGTVTINSVTFGIQQATVDDINVNVNLYIDLNGCPASGFGTANAVLIGTASTVVGPADEGTIITLCFPGIEVAAGSDLIVEVETPDDLNDADGPIGFFRTMSNDGGQCDPSYIRAAACVLDDWIDLADVGEGFPDAHLILVIEATSTTGCGTAPVCGDGSCECGEDCANCEADCGPCAVCGNDILEDGEECDGADDAACPDDCEDDCTCAIRGACCDPGGKVGGCDEDLTQGECDAVNGNWLGEGTPCYLCACESAENECSDGKSGGAGCSDTTCCAVVCNIAPECCEIEWDISCSGIAGDECEDTCGNGICGPEEGCGSCAADCGICPGCPASNCDNGVMSQSTSQEIVGGTGVACSDAGITTTPNAWARCFDPVAEGWTGEGDKGDEGVTLGITSVDVGFESSPPPEALGPLPFVVNVYADLDGCPASAFGTGNAPLLGTASGELESGGDDVLINVPFDAPLDVELPAGAGLIVEFEYLLDGTDEANDLGVLFGVWPGSNSDGQCGQTMIRADSCGCCADWTDLGPLGFPNSHLVIVVHTTADDCDFIPKCGDGDCSGGEVCFDPKTGLGCEADCGICPFCGDGACDTGAENENCESCEADCGACPDCGYNCESDLTQSVSDTDGANQVACANPDTGDTTENSWARCFDLSENGLVDAVEINNVTIGIQEATIDGIVVNVNLYIDSDLCPASGFGSTATLLASESIVVGPADEGTLITVDFSGLVPPLVPAGSSLIVEVESPGDGTEEPFFAFRSMTNDLGQCRTSYLRSASCGITDWVPTADVGGGFPDAHLVMTVGMSCVSGCGDCPPDQGGAKGEVDPVDLAGLLGCWGPKTLPGCECFDADGKNGINPLDLATLLGSWGECPLP